jgi:membrane fusion protein, multidrug efflux system
MQPLLPAPAEDEQQNAEQKEAQRDLAFRMLYDEQSRLRSAMEQLQASKASEKKDEGQPDKQQASGDKESDEKPEDQKPPEKPSLWQRTTAWVRTHPILSLVLLVGAIVLIIACILVIHHVNSYEDTDDAFVDGHTDPISSRVNGIVSAVYVEDTTFVKKGQLLVELDRRDNQVAKEQAAATYAQAQASTRAQSPNVPITATDQSTRVITEGYNITSGEENVAASDERYRSSIADLRQAEANEENAIRERDRYQRLVTKQEVSREQFDQRATDARVQAEVVSARRETASAAEKVVLQAKAQLGQAVRNNKAAKQDLPQQVTMQREQVAQRRAAEVAAKAQLDQAELNLEYTSIYAPEDGVIGDKQVQVATQIAPGQELFAITQTNDIWVTANFKETQVRRMHPGQSVTIHVDALSLDFEGYIQALPGASGAVYSLLPPQNATGNYVKVVQRLPVRIRFKPGQNGAERLAPGMSVVPQVWLR